MSLDFLNPIDKSELDFPDKNEGTPVSILPMFPTAHNSSWSLEFSENIHKSSIHRTSFSKFIITKALSIISGFFPSYRSFK